LWTALASDDAAKAYQAVGALARQPEQSVPFLREHLKPAAPVDKERIARLIADLDSDRFVEREKAARELAGLGEAAGPALRNVLAGQPTLDVRRRVEQLVEKLDHQVMSGEQLRVLRAVEVL